MNTHTSAHKSFRFSWKLYVCVLALTLYELSGHNASIIFSLNTFTAFPPTRNNSTQQACMYEWMNDDENGKFEKSCLLVVRTPGFPFQGNSSAPSDSI